MRELTIPKSLYIEKILEKIATSEESDSEKMNDIERRPSSVRMGRRFTLNPLIFAKEERDARRQSLAQLKLSYYPKNAHRRCFFVLKNFNESFFCFSLYSLVNLELNNIMMFSF